MKFILSALLLWCTQAAMPQQSTAAGSLFIIGGGNRSDALVKQLIETSRLRTNDYIIVLPMASEQPEVGFKLIKEQLSKHTTATIRNFDFSKSKDQKWIDSLSGARLIYILGGDQSRFMKVVLNNGIYTAIHSAFRKGSTVAGTSAGAAVMSKYMITGQQLRDTAYRETFDKLWDRNIEFSEGLGLLTNVIIDQHFLKRSRYSRLISALAQKPDHICIGIDEGTALIVHGNKASVAGDSQVLRFAKPTGFKITKDRLLKFENINLSIYTAGDQLDLK